MSKSMLFWLCIVSLGVVPVHGNDHTFRVGAAQAVVSPHKGAFIAGHTLNRRFTGIHDDLYAKAVVVSDGRSAIALFTVDCIGLLFPQLQQVRELVSETLTEQQLPASHIIMSSTHTHAGPDVVGLWGPERMRSGVDNGYLSALVHTCATQIIKAYHSMQPAIARYAVTEFGTDWVYNISEPGELDRTLTVLQFIGENGNSVATLTNFACHPTIVDAVHDQVSADYIGGHYEKMDAAFGGVNLFLQGSIGGWVQPEYEAKTFEQAFLRGHQLADKVIAALRHPRQLLGGEVQFRSKVFTMPVANPGFRLMADAGVIDRKMGEGTLSEIACFSIGDAQFATHPGETVPAMSWSTRKLMKNTGPKFVLGLGMDAMGYIVKPEFFDLNKKIPHAEYLCSMSVGSHAMQLILTELEGLLQVQQ